MTTQITITGFLVGNIWMPNAECWKQLTFNVTDWMSRLVGEGRTTLRDCVLSATNDGDFQSCVIAQGEIEVCRTNGRRKTTRTFPLAMFPSIADCVHENPDWLPSSPDDFDDE